MSSPVLRAALAAAFCLGTTLAAQADTVFALSSTPIVAPAAVGFQNSTTFGTLTSVGTTATAPYNFQDTWNFALDPSAEIGAFVGSLNFVGSGGATTMGIDNLQLRLIGPGGVLLQGWRTSTGAVAGVEQVFSIIAPSSVFAAGSYALQVRGTLVGAASAYAGTLQAVLPGEPVGTVPLPASGWLLAGGLAALGLRLRQRR